MNWWEISQITLWVLIDIGSMFANWSLAKRKNRRVHVWVTLGFLFGVYSTIVLMILRKRAIQG
ncbi:MAG: hypothetical protein A2201_09655 [Alicyclobacillus sp. RIFOXYA1_FULL_53_8]|nr:MAG: hypothetical protein A2201_09655 [Alicyclobacillus sp. RIFOXYA1_FULL_53_8]